MSISGAAFSRGFANSPLGWLLRMFESIALTLTLAVASGLIRGTLTERGAGPFSK